MSLVNVRNIKNIYKYLDFFIFFSVLYFVLFFILSVIRYQNFGIISGDLTIYMQSFWTACHGKFFYSTFAGGSHFIEHFSPIMFFILPIYCIFPSAHTLYFLLILATVVSSYPLYLMFKRNINKTSATCLAIAYLFNLSIISQHTWCLHLAPFIIAPLAFAFYYFEQNNFRKFIVAFIFALMMVEYFIVTMAIFSVYAVIKKRDKKWIIYPLLLSVVFLFISMITITRPAVGGWERIEFLLNNSSEFIKLLIERYSFILHSLGPFLFLPLLSSLGIFLLPTMFTHLFLCAPGRWQVYWHTASLIGIIGILSCYDVLHRLKQRLNISLINVLSFCILFSTLAFTSSLWFKMAQYSPHPKKTTIKAMLNLIPEDVEVTSPRYISTHLAHRHNIYYYDHLKLSDFVVVDFDVGWELFHLRNYWNMLREESKYVRYEPIFEVNRILLLRKY